MMVMLAEATPTQIELAKAHAARMARWGITPPVARPRPVRPIPAPRKAATIEVWPPYVPMAPYDVCDGSVGTEPGTRRTGATIAAEVAHKHGLTLAQLRSAQRHLTIVAARHEAFYRLSRETSLSLPQIGRVVGGKDHTTVLHGIRRHAKALEMGFADTATLRSGLAAIKKASK